MDKKLDADQLAAIESALAAWRRKLEKYMEALALAKDEDHKKMLMDHIDKKVMGEFGDILGLSEAEKALINEGAIAAVDAQIHAEIEAFLAGKKQ